MSEKELNLKLETLDCQWVVEELDRLWFHDNALDFQFMGWVRSLYRRRPGKRRLGELSRGKAEIETARTLRETGKVYSTGDLPKDGPGSVQRRIVEDDQSSEATNGTMSPGCVSEGAAEDFEPAEEMIRKLETIPSASVLVPVELEMGIRTVEEDHVLTGTPTSTLTPPPPLPRRRRKKQRRKHTKSLSELEFDELRGFRDLGFKLTKEDVAPRVVSLVPPHGFDRRKSAQVLGDRNRDERIYPSHAWSIRRPDSPLLNLRMPDPSSEVDMKAHLMFWARTVASTVRQEC